MGCFVVDVLPRAWFPDTPNARLNASFTGSGPSVMNAQDLLQEISDYCRHTGLAESTFGRRAVNDGKLTARLRNGGRITTETLDRIRGFMETNRTAVEIGRAHV